MVATLPESLGYTRAMGMRCTLVVIGAALLVGRLAKADSRGVDSAATEYFDGEKRGGLVLIGMGAVGLGTGGALLSLDSEVARGAAIPALFFGGLHVAAGGFVWIVSNRRRGQVSGQEASDAAGFARRERVRMATVETQFTALKIVEATLVAAGAGIAVYGFQTDRDRWAGIGLGLAAESAATLVFDIVAAKRAGRYVRRLESLKLTVAPSMHGFSAAIGGSFEL